MWKLFFTYTLLTWCLNALVFSIRTVEELYTHRLYGSYRASVVIVRRGPPPGMGWYGPYHDDLFAVPSQFYPHYVPRKVTCVQLDPITGVAEQWSPHFFGVSRVGVVAPDRQSVVYDFDRVDTSVPRYSSCRVRAVSGSFYGFYSQHWDFVYGLSQPIFFYNNLWGHTTDFNNAPCQCDGDELGQGLDTDHGTILGLAHILIRPANWSQV